MKRLSIIIPAYNAEATINRCLDSVYALPMSEDEFEVIVIDDCSIDHTVDTIKEYRQLHTNLTLFVQSQNHRQGAARNRGVDIANGECIAFLDSDDEIAPGILSALDLSHDCDLDMVVMCYESLSYEGNLVTEHTLPYEPKLLFTGVALQSEFPYWCSAPWAYLYRLSFLKRIDYPFAEDVLFEDSDFVNVHLFHSARMAYSNERGYRLWSNPLSTTHTVSYKHVCDYALLGTRMLSFYQELEDKSTPFANSILEGGSYNIMRSSKNLFKLRAFSDIRSFYCRLDHFADRSALLSYSEPAYCWNKWTRFCMKHRKLTTLIVGSVLFLNFAPIIKRTIR